MWPQAMTTQVKPYLLKKTSLKILPCNHEFHTIASALCISATVNFVCIILSEVPASFEFTIHVRPLAKLEVLGLKTELTAGSDSVPFGVAGYDAEDNEFDTLDGLQLTW